MEDLLLQIYKVAELVKPEIADYHESSLENTLSLLNSQNRTLRVLASLVSKYDKDLILLNRILLELDNDHLVEPLIIGYYSNSSYKLLTSEEIEKSNQYIIGLRRIVEASLRFPEYSVSGRDATLAANIMINSADALLQYDKKGRGTALANILDVATRYNVQMASEFAVFLSRQDKLIIDSKYPQVFNKTLPVQKEDWLTAKKYNII